MSERHTYPDRYPPGSHWSITVAWQILDALPPAVLDPTQRAYLAGLISGALMKAAKDGLIVSEALAHLPKLKQGTKPAICHKCGKDLHGRVPHDAEQVTCFRCSEGGA